jgi:hypothetical protein
MTEDGFTWWTATTKQRGLTWLSFIFSSSPPSFPC